MPGYRFVDRDMVMRYYWGLAVGHVYTHSTDDSNLTQDTLNDDAETNDDLVLETDSSNVGLSAQLLVQEDSAWAGEGDDPEFSFENREDDFIDELTILSSDEEGDIDGDDDEALAMNDMYVFNYD